MTNGYVIRISRLLLLPAEDTENSFVVGKGSMLDSPTFFPKGRLHSGAHYCVPIAKASVT